MTIMHHPSDATLAAFATGRLDEGQSIVVATHLATCSACRKATRAFECIGGIALDDTEPVPMAADALARALAAISSAAPGEHTARDKINIELPGPLASYPLGEWRWIGPGVHWRSVGVPSPEGTRLFMLKAAPGTKIPRHEHRGNEWTCVLQGAFRHQYGVYGAGDFDEADEAVEHQPVIEDGVECICLVALQGGIRLKSPIGRLIQPFVRI
jgi:putative transcriptional regulator